MSHQPLAARMRPRTLDDLIGQDHLIYPGSPLQMLTQDAATSSVLLWGPPGTGKTTIANIIAETTKRKYIALSATSATVKHIRVTIEQAQKNLREDQQTTVVFLDEIHRFTKAQQDVLLPVVEDGTILLIGATTENPSFSVISALSSRSTLLKLKPLEVHDIVNILKRAVEHQDGLNNEVALTDEAYEVIATSASGDARQALTLLETAYHAAKHQNATTIEAQDVYDIAPQAIARYDRSGDQHYDITSAFIKSMRGSDPDAAVYWLARMIDAGEDPRFIARRLIVHASEDVGMADPSVLPVVVAAAQAVQLIGLPEARINLAQAAIAIATAPKSPAVIASIDNALKDVKAGKTGEVPIHLRDAHYPGAKALGHGADYQFPHNYPGNIVAQQYLPDDMVGTQYYKPTDNGFEHTVSQRLAAIRQFIAKHSTQQ